MVTIIIQITRIVIIVQNESKVNYLDNNHNESQKKYKISITIMKIEITLNVSGFVVLSESETKSPHLTLTPDARPTMLSKPQHYKVNLIYLIIGG